MNSTAMACTGMVTQVNGLNIKTIAEHVEDAQILDAVSALGIDYAQGYHISRPPASIRSSDCDKAMGEGTLKFDPSPA